MSRKKPSSDSLGVILQLVGAKWKLFIIKELLPNGLRFSELKKKLGCTAKVLTICLREMEQDGLIIREISKEKLQKTEYYLTDIGYTLKPVIESMQKWGKEYKKLQKLMEKYGNETEILGT